MRVGVRPVPLGVTVERICSGEICTRHWMGDQGAVAETARKRSQVFARVNAVGTPKHQGSTGWCRLARFWRTVSNPGSGIFLHTTPYLVRIEI